MDPRNFVNYVAQEITVDHSVDRSFENGRNHITSVAAVASREAAQVSEKPEAAGAIWQNCLFIIHERNQFITSDSRRIRRPIPPAIGRIDCPLKFFSCKFRFFFTLELQIIEKLQKHDPSQHRQPIQIAIQPLVFCA